MALAVALACMVNSSAWAAEPVEKMQAVPPQGELRRKLEAAQNRLDSAAREIADLSMTISEEDGGPMPGVSPRAALGVNIGGSGVEDRTDGVEVISVSPGGAAAEAGIRAGDVLTEVEGKALKSDDDGTPRNKLLAAMRRVQPDEKVVVKYLRDGKTTTATLTPRRVEHRLFAMPGMPFPGQRGPMGEGHVMLFRGMGAFGNAELVSLTPKLGQYFGADKGLLVVRAPNDSRFKLEEGDVILDIDGRVPASPSHAMRILSSYQAGEKLKLNVLRMKKRTPIDITVPEDRDVVIPRERGAFLLQSPAAPPLPPQPFDLPVPAPD